VSRPPFSRNPRSALKSRDFFRREFAPVTRRDGRVLDRSNSHAPEPHDRVADRLEHLPHLTLPPFVNRQFDRGLIA